MPTKDGIVEIAVCLGSSCFARGNCENLAMINQYLQNHELGDFVSLTGRLCEDQCIQGPNLTIGKESHHYVTADKLRELLEPLGRLPGGDHEIL